MVDRDLVVLAYSRIYARTTKQLHVQYVKTAKELCKCERDICDICKQLKQNIKIPINTYFTVDLAKSVTAATFTYLTKYESLFSSISELSREGERDKMSRMTFMYACLALSLIWTAGGKIFFSLNFNVQMMNFKGFSSTFTIFTYM